jgi:hypothetical protein
MKALHSLVAAEAVYAAKDHDDDGVLEYAQKLISTEGTHDGLYWPREAGNQASPLGELAVEASEEGNTAENIRGAGFHGYRYRLLTKQGAKAAGGAYDYMANGNLVGGFAAVAYPAEHGKSGVMTFVVNRNGKIYQKDLGPETEKLATSMESYNPDETWTAQ